MPIIAVVSQKGGVGKTTLTLNVGYALAERGWKTLVVDTDPQGGIGFSIGPGAARSQGLAAVLAAEVGAADAVLATRHGNFHLLPVGHVGAAQRTQWGAALDRRLADVIFDLAANYDVVLIDTPAGLGGATLAAIQVADAVVSPLQSEPLALRSVTQLVEMLAYLRSQGQPKPLAALIPTMVQTRVDASLGVTQEAFRLFPDDVILESFVPLDAMFLRASQLGVPVALTARRPPPVATVFDRIAAELEARIGLLTEEENYEPIPLLD